MAEYLDNDEDGNVDDPDVVQAMYNRNALLVMFKNSYELESAFENRSFDEIFDNYHIQDLQADETDVMGRFDATLEEVLHLI